MILCRNIKLNSWWFFKMLLGNRDFAQKHKIKFLVETLLIKIHCTNLSLKLLKNIRIPHHTFVEYNFIFYLFKNIWMIFIFKFVIKILLWTNKNLTILLNNSKYGNEIENSYFEAHHQIPNCFLLYFLLYFFGTIKIILHFN